MTIVMFVGHFQLCFHSWLQQFFYFAHFHIQPDLAVAQGCQQMTVSHIIHLHHFILFAQHQTHHKHSTVRSLNSDPDVLNHIILS